MRRRLFLTGLAAGALAKVSTASAQGTPLPSWAEGKVRNSILDFVTRTTTPGSRDWVPVLERIACFDNDGTLWTEQPMYFQVMFAMDRVRAMAAQNPQWREQEPFKWVLTDDRDALGRIGERGILQIMAATHAGQTTEQFRATVLDWLATARHPRFGRPYTDLVYQPMLELLALLRVHQFKTYIVSGGGIDFMRPWTERIYGIPPEQVVGSSGMTRWSLKIDGTPELLREAAVEFVDDGPGKPVGIDRFIGRRPVFTFGNSDGDQQMLEWTAAGAGPRFMGLVHHTDAVREYAYDRDSPVGRLDTAWNEALRRGWTVVDMKADWKVIYPFELR